MFLALKARNDSGGIAITPLLVDAPYFAPSALPKFRDLKPGALPQAITFRAFGAGTRNSTPLLPLRVSDPGRLRLWGEQKRRANQPSELRLT